MQENGWRVLGGALRKHCRNGRCSLLPCILFADTLREMPVVLGHR